MGKKHSEIGASSAHRWMNCPGSVRLSRGLPPSPPNIHTATGSLAHHIAEECFKAYYFDMLDTHRFLNNQLNRIQKSQGFDITITEEMLEAVDLYVHFLFDLIKDAHNDSINDAVRHGLEQKFHLEHIDQDAFGTADFVLTEPNQLTVVDFKYGYKKVEVEDNPQLLYYALGAYYGLSTARRNSVETVRLFVVQPRTDGDGDGISEWATDTENLLNFEKRLADSITLVRDPNSPLQVGDWCQYCPVAAVCSAKRESIAERAELDFSAVDDKDLSLPVPRQLSPDQIAKLLENAEELRAWIGSVWEYATVMANGGTEIPGFKLVQKAGNRAWTEPKKVIDQYYEEFGDAIFDTKLKSPAQLEKIVGKKRKDELEDYYTKPARGTYLVEIADERDGISKDVENVFTPIKR